MPSICTAHNLLIVIKSSHFPLHSSQQKLSWITRHCNVPLHLVTVPGNRTHKGLPWHIPTSCSPLIWFVTASHYVIVPTVTIVVDTTVFPPDTLFCTIAL